MKDSISLNVLKLLSGRFLIQGLGFLTIPLVTRLFLPEQFGVLQVFNSITTIAIVIAGLKYEMSIPLARNDQEASASLSLSTLIVLLFSMLIAFVLLNGDRQLIYWLNLSDLKGVLWWLFPLVVLAGGIRNVLELWAIREQQFGAMAWTEVSAFLVERILHILWGLLIGASVVGLFTGQILGILTGVGLLLIATRTSLFSKVTRSSFSIRMLQTTAVRYKKFPYFNAWSVFLNTVSLQLPPLILGAYFSNTIVGYYALGYKVINTPIMMLNQSISKVFFPLAAKEYHEHGSLTAIVKTFFTRLVQIGIFSMAAIAFAGPVLFVKLFGPQWQEAGIYAQMLSFWYAVMFITLPQIFIICNRQEIGLVMNVLTLLIRAGSLMLGVGFASPRMTLGIFVAASIVSLLVSLNWQLRLAQVSRVWALKMLFHYACVSAVLLCPVLLFPWARESWVGLVGTLGLGCTGYIGYLFFSDRSFRQFLFDNVARFRNSA